MSKTKTPIKNTSVPSAYDTPLTTLEYLRKVEAQNAQVLARQDEIEEALNDRVAKSGDTMTGTLNLPQVNANTGVFHGMNVVSQDEKTHVEADNNGFVAEVNVTDLNKKYGVIALPNGKVGFYAHDATNNKDVNFIIPNMDDYEAGTYELATKDDIPEPSGGDVDNYTEVFSPQTGNYNFNITFKLKIINTEIVFFEIDGSVANDQKVPLTSKLFTVNLPDNLANKIKTMFGTYYIYPIELTGITKNSGSAVAYNQNGLRVSVNSNDGRIVVYGPSSGEIFPSGTFETYFRFTGMGARYE